MKGLASALTYVKGSAPDVLKGSSPGYLKGNPLWWNLMGRWWEPVW
jgi:hypothetical protein